jgi:hypothetical protein
MTVVYCQCHKDDGNIETLENVTKQQVVHKSVHPELLVLVHEVSVLICLHTTHYLSEHCPEVAVSYY